MLNHPTKREECAQLRYGEWAGKPQGTPYNPERCAYEVWHNMTAYQCLRSPGYGPDGLYCKQHARIMEVAQ